MVDSGGERGWIEDAGLVKPPDGPLMHRILAYAAELGPLIASLKPHVVVVELPFAGKRRPGVNRSDRTLPTYGIAVGIAIGCARQVFNHNPQGGVYGVPVDTWSKGLPKGDEHKSARVALACHQYGFDREALGARTMGAGDVADAILLAGWAVTRMRLGLPPGEGAGIAPIAP